MSLHGMQYCLVLAKGNLPYPPKIEFALYIEWPALKRTTMIMEFQPPCYVQGCQPPDQAAQSHIQPGLDLESLKHTYEIA